MRRDQDVVLVYSLVAIVMITMMTKRRRKKKKKITRKTAKQQRVPDHGVSCILNLRDIIFSFPYILPSFLPYFASISPSLLPTLLSFIPSFLLSFYFFQPYLPLLFPALSFSYLYPNCSSNKICILMIIFR